MLFEYRHNPYFNRWFSAKVLSDSDLLLVDGHNPYFNRWFSAKFEIIVFRQRKNKSQSLF